MRAMWLTIAAAALWCVAGSASAQPRTLVRFDTVMGDFNVLLLDDITPITVANFLGYVDRGDYDDTMINRSAPGFLIQGGGWTFDGTAQEEPVDYPEVPEQAAIQNEPFVSNTRGTIGMAKDPLPEGGPDSATSQWYFNLADNSGVLDVENGGYSVFGTVLGDGMDVVDAIAALPTFGFEEPWDNAPMRNYTQAEFEAFVPVDGDNVVLIHSIRVITPGDFDYDGDVDLDDYNTLSGNYSLASGAAYEDGDTDHDGDVDFEDFVRMALNFGPGPTETLADPLPAAPEPATGALMLAALGVAARRPGRR